MAIRLQEEEEGGQENFRKQLSVAVRNIRWSYAIFWSISTNQQGVLEWGDGYYNGDIKTVKTVQAMEHNTNQMDLQRTEQLRELYKSLSAGETNQHTSRPSAALSPEDLTNAEWYYLVCMSFVFNPGQGLPGRSYANCQPIWLCNAHLAHSKVFTRSLLAKSASIQTVVCFPFLGGVIELGVTELVSEDLGLIQHIKTSFLEFQNDISSVQTTSSSLNADNCGDVCAGLNHRMMNTTAMEKINPVVEETENDQATNEKLHEYIREELKADSPHESSNGYEPNQQIEDSFMIEGMNDGASPVQNWQYMDDEFRHCISMSSSESISQTFVNPDKFTSCPKGKKVKNLRLQGRQGCNHTRLGSWDIGSDDLHYSRTVSALFRNSHNLDLAPSFYNGDHGSSCTNWKKGGLKPCIGTPQKILKKILTEASSTKDNGGKDGLLKPIPNENGSIHASSERRRRVKLDERFLVLRSLVPSISKMDKASILRDTIEYLKELERRVAELEERMSRKHPDIIERTSDNCSNRDNVGDSKKPLGNKRKSCHIDGMDHELNSISSQKDGPPSTDVTVSTIDKEVQIEMRCSWRESLLLDIMDAVSNLNLNAYSVQSSTVNGILALTLKSKFRGAMVASAGMIKQALHTIVHKC